MEDFFVEKNGGSRMRKMKVKELNGDMFTPISLFQTISGKKKFLLESSLKNEETGRYSFVGSDPFMECTANGQEVDVEDSEGKRHLTGDPISIIDALVTRVESGESRFPFMGGGIGYLGYDVIRQMEQIGITPHDQLHMPDIHLMFYEKVIVFDHVEQKVFIVVSSEGTEDLDHRIMAVEAEMRMIHLDPRKERIEKLSFQAQLSKEEFMMKVEKAKESILKGDVFQVVLSQRLQAQFNGDAFSFYRSLRKSNPSPYMFFIDFEEYVVLGASPESLIRVKGSEVTTNPIAGTRKRGNTVEEDRRLETELLGDEKEIAEHRMLVDLGRNDLGRICDPGTIRLSKYMLVERYKYVMHIVSEVKGRLKEGISPLQSLAACLPAGTVSGAPKIRAMQIINDLEPVKRGVYSGAVGYMSFTGDLDFALAIRTMVVKDQMAFVQAGAGIVFDSDPASEFEETMNKAKSLLEVSE
ncbi:anthranilate synthase component I [Rossellomorea marisflavi]|uniref:anthranilate synthase component I n=1 Tax=Rossellomorea marisflavi TaxID=189381 RepID=UPI003EB9BFF3